MAQLSVNKVSSIGEMLLQEQPVTIGRSSHNMVVLPDNQVSRHHCVIEMADGQTVIRDQKSRFGTRVNGEPIEEAVLHDGDTISVGPYEIVFADPNAKRPEVELVEAEELDLDESEIDLSIADAMGEHEELDRQRTSLVEQQNELQVLRDQLEAQQAAIAHERTLLEEQQTPQQTEPDETEAQELEVLRQRAATLEQQLTHQQQTLESQLEAAHRETTTEREKVASLETEHGAIHGQVEQLQADLKARRAELEFREAELAEAKQASTGTADEHVARQQQALEEQRHALEQQRVELEQVAGLNDHQDQLLRRRLTDLEEALASHEASGGGDSTALREQLDAARREAQLQREKADAAHTEHEEVRLRLEQLQTDLEVRQEQLAERERELEQQFRELQDQSEQMPLAREDQDLPGAGMDKPRDELAESLMSLSEAAQADQDDTTVPHDHDDEPQSPMAHQAQELAQEREALEARRQELVELRSQWEASKAEFTERSENTRRELMERLQEAEDEIAFLQGDGDSIDLPPEESTEQMEVLARPRKQRTIDPLKLLRRYAATIIIAGILGGGMGYGAYLVLLKYSATYTESVTFEILPRLPDGDAITARDIPKDAVVNRLASTELVLLNGRDVLKQAIEDVKIRQTKWHEKFLLPDNTFAIEAAIDDIQQSTSPQAMRGSNLFSLQWSSSNPNDVPIVLNAIAMAYRDMRQEQDHKIYESNIDIFRAQRNETDRNLENLEQEMRNFIRDNGITTMDDTHFAEPGIASQSLAVDRATLIMSIENLETATDQIVKRLEGWVEPTPSDYILAENDYQLSNITQSLLELKTEYRRVSERYAPGHPIVKRVEERMNAVQIERDAKINEVIMLNLEAQRLQLAADLEQMQSLLAQTGDESKRKGQEQQELAKAHSQLASMRNRRTHFRLRRESINQLLKEVELMRTRADASRVRITKLAIAPREVSFPKKQTMVPAGVIGMMGLVVAVVVLRELTDQRVRSSSDLSVIPGATVIGVIPDISDDPEAPETPELVVQSKPKSLLAESYRQAFTGIFAAMEDDAAQILMLTGGLPGAGTTTVVTNAAALATDTGKRVLVVDANFRRPHLAAALGVEDPEFGLGDLLGGNIELDEAIIDTGHGIDLVHAGTPASRIGDRLSDTPMDKLVAQLRSRYDLIIIDTPPSIAVSDALAIAEHADAAILVVRANQEHRGLVARLIQELDECPAEAMGVLLNRPRRTVGGYFKKNYAAIASYSTEQPA